MRDDIIEDYKLHIIIDDVSEDRTEFRASVYNDGGNLIGEAWEDTPKKAALVAITDAHKEQRAAQCSHDYAVEKGISFCLDCGEFEDILESATV